MSHNYIGPPGGRALAEAFEANRKFTRLHLGANRFRDEGAIALAGAVRANTALRNLTLSFNGVKAKGAAALAAVLANNGSSLRALELDQNPLGDKGVVALGDALATNAVVEYVDVHATGMGDGSGTGATGSRTTQVNSLNWYGNFRAKKRESVNELPTRTPTRYPTPPRPLPTHTSLKTLRVQQAARAWQRPVSSTPPEAERRGLYARAPRRVRGLRFAQK